MSGWNPADLTLPEVSMYRQSGSAPALVLTLLYHPVPARIGETAVLPRVDCARLDRLYPLFCQPRKKGRGSPLDDPYLSRSPVEILTAEGSLLLRPPRTGVSLKVNGRIARDDVALSTTQLDTGVVITLAQRVVLLLHRQGSETLAADDCGLVGEHDSMHRVRQLVERVAGTDTSVLLLGESGTGKEMVAAAIHHRSDRDRLVAVNMAAVPADLAAAELFGVRRGAFTGAEADRPGYFLEADGGTLFLDEIGACGPDIQAQLLRALAQGEVQSPGGGTAQVDVRVIAATDADPGASFSTALRHRLGGFEVYLAPLRERRCDIGRLLAHFMPHPFLENIAADAREVSRLVDLVTRMALYDWPGNVRELANYCRQVEIASGDRLLIPDNVGRVLSQLDQQSIGSTSGGEPPSDEQVREALSAARWEISRAARELSISRQALYRRIETIPELRAAGDIPGAEVEAVFFECKGDLEAAAMRLKVSQPALKRRWRAMDLLPERW